MYTYWWWPQCWLSCNHIFLLEFVRLLAGWQHLFLRCNQNSSEVCSLVSLFDKQIIVDILHKLNTYVLLISQIRLRRFKDLLYYMAMFCEG